MELFYLLNFLIVIIVVRADVEGQREVPQDMSEDMYAPNSVPMMGKKGGPAIYERKYFLPLPMLRLKREKESPFVYRTPWHIGKRSPPDLYTASWIGSLFKPSSADIENKHNRRMKFSRSGSNKGKKSAMSWDWDNLVRESPGFRFNDNRNFLYDRDIMHKRNTEQDREIMHKGNMEEGREILLPSNWEEFGEFDDFTGLMEDVSLYPSSLGLFDRTILTRVQKRDQDQVKKRETPSSHNENTKQQTEEVNKIF